MKTFIDCSGYTLLAEPLGRSKETLLAGYIGLGTPQWTGQYKPRTADYGLRAVYKTGTRDNIRTTDYDFKNWAYYF